MLLKVGVHGCAGRMGSRICALAARGDVPGVELVAAVEHKGHPAVGSPLRELVGEVPGRVTVQSLDMVDVGEVADVIIDFSSVEGTVNLCSAVARLSAGCRLRGLIIGTTGLGAVEKEVVAAAASIVPVLHASNYSLGVNLLFKLAAQVARTLGDDFNIEIVESHHNQKVDSPSGTAVKIAEEICQATERNYEKDVVHGRQGLVGKRPSREIGMHAVRMGGVMGDHSVYYASPFERIEITHRAEDRDVFAAGALRASLWMARTKKRPRMYQMSDVLELEAM